MDISYYWSGDRDGRRKFAQEHTKEMNKNASAETYESVNHTKTYSPSSTFNIEPKNYETMVKLEAYGTTDGIYEYAQGKTAALNFASYKEPGGRFIDGSRAQEECLCAESNLYNILRQFPEYYEWNKEGHLNRAQYLNRALYTPHVLFDRPNLGEDERYILCDIITCAAPNITPARKYGWNVSEVENSQTLDSRIKFVLSIAAEQNVDTLILGAYGCGVFGQDATEVAKIFVKYLKNEFKGQFQTVIFAIPQDVHGGNYDKFKAVLDKEKKS